MPKQLTYLQARVLLLLLGLALAISQTLLAWERGAAPTEVLAPALYIPVFAGAIFFSYAGGVVAAGVSSLIYGVLLSEQTAAIGMRLFVGLLVNRVATYLFYGIIIAVAARYLESRLRKLEMHDLIDDVTELFNPAFFLENTELEMERAKRYQTLFSITELNVDREAFAGFPRRRYRRVLRELGRRIEEGIRAPWTDPFRRRNTDLPVRVDEGDRDRFFFILPETGPQGADVFTQKVAGGVREFLGSRGCAVDGHVDARTITFPEDAGLLELAQNFRLPGEEGARARQQFEERAAREPLTQLRQEVAEVEAERRAIRGDEPD